MDNQAFVPITMCLSKVTLAAGTTSTLSTTGTTVFAIEGKAYSKAALSNVATPTTDWATGAAFIGVTANNGCSFIVGFDSGGNLKAIQSTIQPLNTSGAFIRAPVFGGFGPAGSGSTNNDFCPIGYVIIKAGSTANATTGWIFGTSDMASVTGITYTFGDLVGWPDRPIIA
jgi:hypothetical protein